MTLLANRYARAMFEAAAAKAAADAVGDDLRALAAALAEPEIRAVALDPDTPAKVRRATLEKLVEGKHDLVRSLVEVVLHRHRIDVLTALPAAYHGFLLESRGEVEGVLETARPMDDAAVQELADRATALVGKKVTLRQQVDEELIGGVRLRVGNTLWDGSVATALEELERQLMQSAI